MKKETLRRGGVYALLTIWGIFVLFPFYWMLLSSVKSYSSYNSEYIPKLFTLTPTLQNYVDAFKAVRWMGKVSGHRPWLPPRGSWQT